MRKMARESAHGGREDFVENLVEEVASYVAEGKYPDGCTPKRKRQIRKRTNKFALQDRECFISKKTRYSDDQVTYNTDTHIHANVSGVHHMLHSF